MIITIDGPASAGKGTLASFLASCYRLAYFDTGMVYRAVGLEMFLRGLNVEDEAAAAEIAAKLTFQRMMESLGWIIRQRVIPSLMSSATISPLFCNAFTILTLCCGVTLANTEYSFISFSNFC